ncbi:MAG TPA: DUF533 domain-containing protein [Vicinamibacterales bacterium]|nr:DUF533 domain-containing protein [Vicinamibacterales bacterium]
MDTSQILSIFLRGAMGSRGRKRARRAANFLSGNKGFLTASTVLGAAGIAWGIYETLQSQGGAGGTGGIGAAGAAGATGAAGGTGAPGATDLPAVARSAEVGGAVVPPVPVADSPYPPDVLRVVRLAVSAARADGTLLPAERALILSHAREAGLDSVVEVELSSPRPLSEIVSGVTQDQHKRDLYVLAYTIVRADEHVSGAERVYLAQLAHQLGLEPATIAGLEAETASKIDASPETAE